MIKSGIKSGFKSGIKSGIKSRFKSGIKSMVKSEIKSRIKSGIKFQIKSMKSVLQKVSYNVYFMSDMLIKKKIYNDLENLIKMRLDVPITFELYDNIWDTFNMIELNMGTKNG